MCESTIDIDLIVTTSLGSNFLFDEGNLLCNRIRRPINVSINYVPKEMGFMAACADRDILLQRASNYDWIIHSEDDVDIRLSNFLSYIREYEFLERYGPPESMPILLRMEVKPKTDCLVFSDMGCGIHTSSGIISCTATTMAANTFRLVKNKLYMVDFNSYMAAMILKPKEIQRQFSLKRWTMAQMEALELHDLLDTREYCSGYALYESIPCTEYSDIGRCVQRRTWQSWKPDVGRFVAYNPVATFESLYMMHLSNKQADNAECPMTSKQGGYRISSKDFLSIRGIKYDAILKMHYLDEGANQTEIFFYEPY